MTARELFGFLAIALAAAVGVFLVLLSRDMGWLTWLW